jgi:16S rRNA (guanine(966)-N(2))-methyltransferase RsmD
VRIIGGRWKRTGLPVVTATGLRPTPDRVRETVFNWLAHVWGGAFGERSALDLFAGTGALGIEAGSRGARPVVLIEQDTDAVAALRDVLERLHAEEITVLAGDALRHGARLVREGRHFDVVFLDPPFSSHLLAPALTIAAALCTFDGYVYVESGEPLSPAMLDEAGLEMYRSDKAGEVLYHLLQRKIIEEETSC